MRIISEDEDANMIVVSIVSKSKLCTIKEIVKNFLGLPKSLLVEYKEEDIKIELHHYTIGSSLICTKLRFVGTVGGFVEYNHGGDKNSKNDQFDTAQPAIGEEHNQAAGYGSKILGSDTTSKQKQPATLTGKEHNQVAGDRSKNHTNTKQKQPPKEEANVPGPASFSTPDDPSIAANNTIYVEDVEHKRQGDEHVYVYDHHADIIPEDETITCGDGATASPGSTAVTSAAAGAKADAGANNPKALLTCKHVNEDHSSNDTGHRFMFVQDKHQDYQGVGSNLLFSQNPLCDLMLVVLDDRILQPTKLYFKGKDDKDLHPVRFRESDVSLKNKSVQKIGATTRTTFGKVIKDKFDLPKVLNDVIEIEGSDGNFSEKGDSGSLVTSVLADQETECMVYGMVYGSYTKSDGRKITIAFRLDPALKELEDTFAIAVRLVSPH